MKSVEKFDQIDIVSDRGEDDNIGIDGEAQKSKNAEVLTQDTTGAKATIQSEQDNNSDTEEEDWEASVPISAPKQVDFDESNSLEIWNFPSYYTNKELESLFGLKVDVKWIDDTSAIIHFTNPQDLKRGYLQLSGHPTIKHKIYIPMEKRDRSSRPTTTDMVARRMIAGALGMQSRLKKTASEKEEDTVKLRMVREEKEKEIKRKAEEKNQRLKASNQMFDS